MSYPDSEGFEYDSERDRTPQEEEKNMEKGVDVTEVPPEQKKGSSDTESYGYSGPENVSSDTLPKITAPKRKRVWKKHMCEECGVWVTHLPRHQRQVHGGVFDTKKVTFKKSSRYYLRICPVGSCQKQVARLRDHMSRTHHIKDKEELDRLMAKSEKLVSLVSSEEEEVTAGPSFIRVKPVHLKGPDPTVEIYQPESSFTFTSGESDTESPPDVDSSEDEFEENPYPDLKYHEVVSITRFIGWLQGPQHLKTARASQQHGSQVFNIWQHVRTQEDFHPMDLLNIDKVEEKWLGDFIDTFQPGTVKSYLGSLTLYFKYILDKNLQPGSREELHRGMTRLSNISRRMKRKVGQRQTAVQTACLETGVTAEDIKEFVRSKFCRNIERQLQSGNNNLDRDMYNKVRDFLILRILFANGQRAGTILNLTQSHLDHAMVTSEGATVMVEKHKTDYVAPASLALPEPLFAYVKTYIKMTRRLAGFVPRRDTCIFVSFPTCANK